jgi:hypothetical protein
MIIANIYEDVIKDPEKYVSEILKGSFEDVEAYNDKAEKIIFKNLQIRGGDEFADFLNKHLPNFEIKYNFVRQSPFKQKEPNFIHKDDMMGDVTCLLYLNNSHPKDYGTTIYDDSKKKTFTYYAKYNSLLIFDSQLNHSRNIEKNFGAEDKSRLVQVAFLKYKNGN